MIDAPPHRTILHVFIQICGLVSSLEAPSVSSTVQMALYRPRGLPPGRQEEDEQLRSEDAPPLDDRLAEGAPTEATETEPGSEEAEQQQERQAC